MVEERFIFAAFLSFILIMASMSTALAAGVRGSATVTTTTFRSEIDDTTESIFSLDQRYLLGLDSELSPLLKWRTDLRDLESLDDAEEGRSTRRELELFSELLLSNPLFDWSSGLRLGSDTSKDPGSRRKTLTDENFSSRLDWRAEGFPSLTLRYDKERTFDDLPVALEDRKRDRYLVESEYTYGPITLFESFTYEEEENRVSAITSENFDNLGSIDFQKDFQEGKISLVGNYQISYDRNEETAERAITVQRLRLARRGLYSAQDTTPADGQLDDTPSLIDSDINTSATDGLGNAINIGGGNTFRNIGVELRAAEVVNRLLVYVRPGDPDLSGVIVWTVYFSDDGQSWSPRASTSFFDSVENRYEISFTEPSAHLFFKVVNESTSGVLDSFVTEVEALGPLTLEAGETEVFTTLIQDFNSTVTYRPVEMVTLSYDFFHSRSKRETETRDFTETISNYGLGLQVDPSRALSTVLRFERNSLESEQNDVETLTDRYSLTVLYTPWETLTATLSAARNETEEDDKNRSRFDSVSLQVLSEIYRGVNVNATVGLLETTDFFVDTETRGLDWTLDVDAELRRYLIATLSYDGSRSREEPQDIETERHDVSFLLIWRPTQQLNLSGEWGYRDADEFEGFSQRYTLDWLPFPDGNVDLNFFYELGIDEAENRTRQRFNGGLRWALNRKTDFRLDYIFDKGSNTTREEIHILDATLDIRF